MSLVSNGHISILIIFAFCFSRIIIFGFSQFAIATISLLSGSALSFASRDDEIQNGNATKTQHQYSDLMVCLNVNKNECNNA